MGAEAQDRMRRNRMGVREETKMGERTYYPALNLVRKDCSPNQEQELSTGEFNRMGKEVRECYLIF